MGNKLQALSPPPPSKGSNEHSTDTRDFDSIVEKVETKSKCDNTVVAINLQLTVLQESLTKIENVVTQLNTCRVTIGNYIAKVDTLNRSVNSAAVNIKNAIDAAGKVRIPVNLETKHLQQLEAYKQEFVEQEKKSYEEFFHKENEIMSQNYYALHNMMTNNQGTWLSKNTFFLWMVITFILAGILLTIFAIWLSVIFK